MENLTSCFYNSDFFAAVEQKGETPICLRTKDSYYMINKGLEERRYIYLNKETLFSEFYGNSRSVFTIGEIGFGTGLTFLSALDLWTKQGLAKKSKSLLFVSTEIHPFSPEDLKMVLEPFRSEIPLEVNALCDRYKLLVPGLNILPFLEHNVFLVILVGPAENTLAQSQFLADHWCCDGFSPAKNPSAWTNIVFQNISRLSRQNATLASFSATSSVRGTLAYYGWDVERLPGFAHKAHMTRARFLQPIKSDMRSINIAHIAGGGIAGLSVAYFRAIFGGKSVISTCTELTASQAPYIYTVPRLHRAFDNITRFNLQTHFFSGTWYRDLKKKHELEIKPFYCEPFDAFNRTHRLWDEILEQNPVWSNLIQHPKNGRDIVYPYAIQSSGLAIQKLLSEHSATEIRTFTTSESVSLGQQHIDVLACSWGAQIWGSRYIPNSILKGETFPIGSHWSLPTHERHAFNPQRQNPEGFVGFRSQISSYLPLMNLDPIYTSLHHGSRGFSSGPWCGLLIALSSLGLFEYSEIDRIEE